jgi:hypothetical protein
LVGGQEKQGILKKSGTTRKYTLKTKNFFFNRFLSSFLLKIFAKWGGGFCLVRSDVSYS